jgi:hypothetical protein
MKVPELDLDGIKRRRPAQAEIPIIEVRKSLVILRKTQG